VSCNIDVGYANFKPYFLKCPRILHQTKFKNKDILLDEDRAESKSISRIISLLARIPPRKWMDVSCECCVLSGRGLCIRPITRPRRFLRTVLCLEFDLEALMRRPWPRPIRAVKPWKKNYRSIIKKCFIIVIFLRRFRCREIVVSFQRGSQSLATANLKMTVKWLLVWHYWW